MIENDRLDALYVTQLLDTLPEERFDRLTRLAKNALGVEVALITLIDKERQWFKSKQGTDVEGTPRSIAFCDHTIRGDDVMVVKNLNDDERFKSNPLVTDDPNVSFYAGMPLITKSGHALGTLCVLDSKPREVFSGDDVQLLKDLAASVMTEIEAAQQGQVIEDLNLVNEELRHRMGNMYAHVSALISMLGQNEGDKDQLVRRLRQKITTLGQMQALLAANKWESVKMSALAQTTLAPFLTPQTKGRVTIQQSDDFDVSPRGAFIVTLMLSELGTNAVKHGALKTADGKLSVGWKTGDIFELFWKEDVAQVIKETARQGFGHQILNRIVPLDLQGKVEYSLETTGLTYKVTAKPERIAVV